MYQSLGACCHTRLSYVNETAAYPVECLDEQSEDRCKELEGMWYFDRNCENLSYGECPPLVSCRCTEINPVTDINDVKCENYLYEEEYKFKDGDFFKCLTCSELLISGKHNYITR
ncbi:MAG: hypothetical protein ACMUIM_03035 [bacterium]